MSLSEEGIGGFARLAAATGLHSTTHRVHALVEAARSEDRVVVVRFHSQSVAPRRRHPLPCGRARRGITSARRAYRKYVPRRPNSSHMWLAWADEGMSFLLLITVVLGQARPSHFNSLSCSVKTA